MSSRRVLVAEDEALIRLDIVEILTEAGYDVVGEASNGEEAIRLVEELKPDLCILKEHSCAVVMLTAFSQLELARRAADAGAMAYLTKPFTPADLLPAIEVAYSRFEEIVSLENELEDMQERFETRKRVDRAKGLLQEQMNLSEPEAFRWLQKTSMNRRLTMREVADAVIEQVGGAKKK